MIVYNLLATICSSNVGVQMFGFICLDPIKADVWTGLDSHHRALYHELLAKTHRMRQRNFRKLILFPEVWSEV